MRQMLETIRNLFRRADPVTNAVQMHVFLGQRAAYVCQRSVIEFCRVKTAANWSKLLTEKPFADALDVCRWEGFAATLSDLSVVAEGLLRPHAAGREIEVADWLTESARRNLAAYPMPAHRSAGWDTELAELRNRLALAQTAAPRSAHEVAQTAGRIIHRHMPIHPRLRIDDQPVIVNNVRFTMARVREDMDRIVDYRAVARDILAARAAA